VRMSDGVEWGLHCLAVLAALPDGAALPARALAEFHGVSESYLLKHLKALTAAGLLQSVPGARGGYRLARPADRISFLDAVRAIDGSEPAFRCKQIRRCGPAASADPAHYRLPCAIHAAMVRAEQAWRDELRATRLSDMLGELSRTLPADTRAKAAAWLGERARTS